VVDDRSVEWRAWRDGLPDGAVEEVEHPVTGRRQYITLPLTVDGRPLRTTKPAPMFDQHTDEVLAEWAGLSGDEIAALRAAQAVGTRPAVKRR
jgi:crotonobetainyl-CoA:carnitine CoA-transferase CaiB-like acyl-CoA transferase